MQSREINGKKVVLIGDESLLIQCGEMLHLSSFEIILIITSDEQCSVWAQKHSIPVLIWRDECLEYLLNEYQYDILLSITNLRLLPSSIYLNSSAVVINFHDGPLPEMRGVNTPQWALLQGNERHQVCWHIIDSGIDTGQLIAFENIVIDPDDTAFTLNAKCYSAALASFERVLSQLAGGSVQLYTQKRSESRLYLTADRPSHLGVINPNQTLDEVKCIVRALDTGPYINHLCAAKVFVNSEMFIVKTMRLVSEYIESAVYNGHIIHAEVQAQNISFIVEWDKQAVEFSLVPESKSTNLKIAADYIGMKLDTFSDEQLSQLTHMSKVIGEAEAFWAKMLHHYEPASLCYCQLGVNLERITHPLPLNEDVLLGVFAYFAKVANKSSISFALEAPLFSGLEALFLPFKPVYLDFDLFDLLQNQNQLSITLDKAFKSLPVSADVQLRQKINVDPLLADQPFTVFITQRGFENWCDKPPQLGVALLIEHNKVIQFAFAGHLIKPAKAIVDEIIYFVKELQCKTIQQVRLINTDNIVETIPNAFGNRVGVSQTHVVAALQQQIKLRAGFPAIVFHDDVLTYKQLDRAAQQIALGLMDLGVKPGQKIGLMMARNQNLMPAMIGTLYAGAAFVPMDPAYPKDRLEYIANDAGLKFIICDSSYELSVKSTLVTFQSLMAKNSNAQIEPNVSNDLAYMIYTSGSTGNPKGVMVEHAQLANFCFAMNEVIPRSEVKQDVWLALTSISFDISILELIWTLTQGMKVVIYDGSDWQTTSATSCISDGSMRGSNNNAIDFSLFYWNMTKDQESPGSHRYKLLLDGARYADENGFKAIWTPERHFGDFGGLYPNPVVSSAAIATITKKVQIRAGSCVVPLHHPIRIAEDWAMADNLSDGRIGLSAAAGWMPNDFVIMPENFDDAKNIMFDNLEEVRRLWRGDKLKFQGPHGEVEVQTLPRPVQKELPVWITSAGNPDNFRKAGELGLNVLTHLLGQSVEELADKIKVYKDAWQKAGHQGHGHVSLMLHTFVADSDDQAKIIAREPMKKYLKSALFLVKSAAWEFPTFKKLSESQGQSLDEFFKNISDEDMDALLEFAFERYYTSSGLFGTVDQCVNTVKSVKEIGVNEIACLIDFGIASETVLAHLPFITQVMKASQQSPVDKTQENQKAYGFSSLVKTHGVTHLQCTPSTARLLCMDEEIKHSLAHIHTMLVGGEALPLDLAQLLQSTIKGSLLNMYGPTETTIWSSVDIMATKPKKISLGKPIANTQFILLDQYLQPVPVGMVGELYIGGQGVVPGYWANEKLTKEKFIDDTLGLSSSGRWYKTGDLARYNQHGELEYLGRNDFQVKIRGYRIELGEIEAKMLELEDVQEACVNAVVQDGATEPRLIGYYTLHNRVEQSHQKITSSCIKKHLQASLASFMVPSAFQELQAMPLTPNLKIDRKALPKPVGRAKAIRNAKTKPESQSHLKLVDKSSPQKHGVTLSSVTLEAEILKIWKEVLALPSLTVHDNFFDCGGHSLLVIDVITRLKPLINKPLKLVDFFRFPQVKSLAAFLSNRQEEKETKDVIKVARNRAAARRAARKGLL